MALPQTLVPTAPLGSDSPRGGDDELRGLKQFLADVFGLPVSPTQITSAVSAITAAGEMSRKRAPIKAVVAAYSLTLDDEFILLNKATTDTVTPLAAASAPGKYYKLRNINTGVWTWSGTVIILGTSTVNPTLAQNETLEVWCDGTSYYGLRELAYGVSATPAANTVSVSGSDSFLAQGWFANRPSFSAYYAGTPITATGSLQKITLNTEEYDTNNNFDSTTNYRFTPTVAGKYLLTGSIYCQGSTTLTNIILAIYKNGTIYKREQRQLSFTAGALQTIPITTLVDANGSTDYFELYGAIIGTGTVDYRAGIENLDTSLQGMRIF